METIVHGGRDIPVRFLAYLGGDDLPGRPARAYEETLYKGLDGQFYVERKTWRGLYIGSQRQRNKRFSARRVSAFRAFALMLGSIISPLDREDLAVARRVWNEVHGKAVRP